MRTILMISALFLVAAAMSACSNTADGFGKDMENAGKTIQKKV